MTMNKEKFRLQGIYFASYMCVHINVLNLIFSLKVSLISSSQRDSILNVTINVSRNRKKTDYIGVI